MGQNAHRDKTPWGCFTNFSRALQIISRKIYNASNDIYGENFKLKLCTCDRSRALGTRTKFQREMLIYTLWDRKRTQWATWGLIRTKKDSFWVGRLKWSHCWSQMVSFWVAVRKLLPLGAKLVSFWMVRNHRVSNKLTWSQLVLFWVAYRKAPPQRTKMASFWVVWFPCG